MPPPQSCLYQGTSTSLIAGPSTWGRLRGRQQLVLRYSKPRYFLLVQWPMYFSCMSVLTIRRCSTLSSLLVVGHAALCSDGT
jgi:hypothetical protein